MTDLTAWETYFPTLLRWLGVAVAIGVLMVALTKLLQALGLKREWAIGYGLVLPWVLGLAIWTLYPFGRSLYLSFTQYNIFQPPEWVGLRNYIEMFTEDPDFWPAVRLTLIYAALNVPLGILGALGVAILLNQDVRAIGFWRTVYYLPAVLPSAAVVLLWRWMFSPTSGLINFVLRPVYLLLDMEPLAWFTDPDLVLPAFVIMGMWGVFGANAVILLAALKNVPNHLYEAAELDGAGRWQKFWHVTIPMISSTIFYNVVTGIIGALQIFTVAFFVDIPDRAGTFLNVYIYQQAFSFRHMGYASAMAWFLLVMILLITLLVLRSSAAWVYYAGDQEAEA